MHNVDVAKYNEVPLLSATFNNGEPRGAHRSTSAMWIQYRYFLCELSGSVASLDLLSLLFKTSTDIPSSISKVESPSMV